MGEREIKRLAETLITFAVGPACVIGLLWRRRVEVEFTIFQNLKEFMGIAPPRK